MFLLFQMNKIMSHPLGFFSPVPSRPATAARVLFPKVAALQDVIARHADLILVPTIKKLIERKTGN